MDNTERKITKIAREANRFTVQTMKEDGIGTAEMDVIHFVRHNPGTTQKEMWEALKIDKGATARRVARLEEKSYLTREPNPLDGRSQLLYPTEKAEALRNSKAEIEGSFYEWLLDGLPDDEKKVFCKTLNTLYFKSKEERRAGFLHVAQRVKEKEAQNEDK